ncbi:MAG: hypothetical protein HKM06_08530 [Spirochaetales bacterium]|nr:hypothetical protein [Spirochaetales bacterium]
MKSSARFFKACLVVLLFSGGGIAVWARGLDWIPGLDEGLRLADATKRPLLAQWIPSSAELSQRAKLTNLWDAYPLWTQAVEKLVVPVRLLRKAEARALGLDTSQAGLALTDLSGAVKDFQADVPVLDLSRAILLASEHPLAPPYTVKICRLDSPDEVWKRIGNGPKWELTPAQGPKSLWVEDGPAGPLLLIHNTVTHQKAALPLRGGWSWHCNARGSWSAWEQLGHGQTEPKRLH